MKLSILTICYNNAEGLRQTFTSVKTQVNCELEHVVVDGASADGSADIIREYAESASYPVVWVSEPDKGIYNAMNKAIRMASGDFIQILNSGDTLATADVTARMQEALVEQNHPDILYGNMVKCFPDGRKVLDRCFAGQEITMLGFFSGTLNHDPAYIRRSLFDKYGYYDESLRICSDWVWYLDAVILGDVRPVYVDIDVTHFDMTGISENGGKQRQRILDERRQVLENRLPAQVLRDYDLYAEDIYTMRRLRRHSWAYKLVWFVERCLFKFEKWQNNKKNMQQWG